MTTSRSTFNETVQTRQKMVLCDPQALASSYSSSLKSYADDRIKQHAGRRDSDHAAGRHAQSVLPLCNESLRRQVGIAALVKWPTLKQLKRAHGKSVRAFILHRATRWPDQSRGPGKAGSRDRSGDRAERQAESGDCRRSCPKFLRQTFQEFAAHSCGWSRSAKAMYEQKRATGMQHHSA